MNFIVRIDHLSDQKLEFFGWVNLKTGSEFTLYWNQRYNEMQPVSNESPRYLVVDDWNDAQQIADAGADDSIIVGPSPPRSAN